jgi:nucleotide-binding universal stress UspA family protein
VFHILTPVDGSEPSLRAVELAATLARGLGSKLTVLAVRQQIVGRRLVADVWSQDDVAALLKKAMEVTAALGIKDAALAEVKSRDVAHAIVDYAEQNDVDLIVMGASGMGSIKSFVIGAVSDEVLRKSICPVTIVH